MQSTATFGAQTLTSQGPQDAYVARVDASGTVQWGVQVGGPYDFDQGAEHEQEAEQHLDAGQRDPKLVQKLHQLAVVAVIRRLLVTGPGRGWACGAGRISLVRWYGLRTHTGLLGWFGGRLHGVAGPTS